MRDFIAGLAALVLLLTAASLMATLAFYRRRREQARDDVASRGQAVIAEIPHGAEMTLFTEDAATFSYGEHRIDKAQITAARVLINGSPIAAHVSSRFPREAGTMATTFEDRPEGISHDRWDVAIETTGGTTLVECGAIRERISQELARRIFEAVKTDLAQRDQEAHHSTSASPAR